jgi:uncharacterized protein YukE
MGHGNGIKWYRHLELPGDGLDAANACLNADPPRPPGCSAEFYGAASLLGRRAQALRDALAKLGAIACTEGVWTGDAADAFRRTLQDAHRAHYDQVPDRYDGYARAVREYASALDGHQASIDSARADVQAALDAQRRAATVAGARALTTSGVGDCQAAAHRFRAAYNDWVDSVTRCEHAIERVDDDKLHNAHGMHVALDAVARYADIMSSITGALALVAIAWPPAAIFLLEVSSVCSLAKLGADAARATVYHEKVTVGDFVFDALGSVPIMRPGSQAVRAGRELKDAGVLAAARNGARAVGKSFVAEAKPRLVEAAHNLKNTKVRPSTHEIRPTLEENWRAQDIVVNTGSVGREAYDNRLGGWPRAVEQAAFSVVLGPLGRPATTDLNSAVGGLGDLVRRPAPGLTRVP